MYFMNSKMPLIVKIRHEYSNTSTLFKMSVKFNEHIKLYPSFRYVEENDLGSYPPSSHFWILPFVLNCEINMLKYCAFVVFCPFLLVLLIGFAICVYISVLYYFM